ncbi:DUF1345 domain-containing protein [Betaproteobacteria bacterium SCN1]|nr:DUF1345 domain-containing protein [Betaproteobacteria bacterium SCN1]
MKYLRLHPHPALHPLARLRAWHRVLAAAAVGTIAALLLPATLWETWLMAGWLAGSLAYLGIVWIGVGRLDAAHTRLLAGSYDPGTRALYAVVVAACFASLGGVLLVTDAARALAGPARGLHIALALATLAATWLLIQTVFTLRYARRYYTDDAGGLAFPGEAAPTYMDFAYFAAVIGMTSQVSDVAVGAAPMRRLALAHGLVSFAFNLLVLALTLNLVASAL